MFIEAEKRYGFDQVLDWMKYGVAGQLEEGHVDQLRDVKMPLAKSGANDPVIYHGTNKPLCRSDHHQTRRDLVGNPAGGHHQRSFLSGQ